MKIENLAHILRAARAITGETVFVLVGSQAILAQYPDAPAQMLQSNEIDLYPKFRPDLSELIEAAMGNGSPFHGTFGYHADGVGPETAVLPSEWEDRAITLQGHPLLEGAIGICPEVTDLAASKLMAFREKDRDWILAAIEAGIVECGTLAGRLSEYGSDNKGRCDTVRSWLLAQAECNDDPSP